MKFVIKEKQNSVKLFTGENPSYETIKSFINREFPHIQNIELTFIDEDGDTVMLCSQDDFDAMLEMFPDKKIMKIDLNNLSADGQKKEDQSPKDDQLEKEDKQKIQQVEKVEQVQKEEVREISQNQKQNIKNKKKNKNKNFKVDKVDKFAHKFNKMKKIFKKEIDEMLNQKLKAELPILITTIQARLKQQNEPVKILEGEPHNGIACNGCGVEPINGIRYRCLECVEFNFCSTCEEKIEHPHDLLKMRKPREQNDEKNKDENRDRKLMKCTRKLIKFCNRSSSNDSSHSKDKCKRWRKRHCHKNRRHQGKLDQEVNENHMMGQWHHPHHPHHGYHHHPPPPPPCMFSGYPQGFQGLQQNESLAIENTEKSPKNSTISLQKIQMKVRKLSLYFDKDESQYVEIVKKHPNKNVKQIIKLLGEQIDEQRLERMKRKYKRESNVAASWIQVSKSQIIIPHSEQKVEQNQEQQPNKVEKPEQVKVKVQEVAEQKKEQPAPIVDSEEEEAKKLQIYRKNSKQIREKGRILMEMKEIFGEERAGQIFRFIEKHFDEGQQKIIDLWLAEECTRRYAQ